MRLAATGASGYTILNSVYGDAATAFFSRTPGSAGNRKIWSVSAWVKRVKLGSYDYILDVNPSADYEVSIRFLSDDSLEVDAYTGSFEYRLNTNRKFRDVGSWFHVLVVFDTTQATADNRIRIYINGVEETSFAARTNPTLNADYYINNNIAHDIGRLRYNSPARYFSCYLAEYYFIDGQALTPSSFGETDAVTGSWKPKRYTGTYGTNGFHLDFADGADLGKDVSGNGNHFTKNGTVTQTTDSPTDKAANNIANFAVLNPLDNGGVTLTNGNRTSSGAAATWCRGTVAVSSGVYYFESKLDTTGAAVNCGVRAARAAVTASNTDDCYVQFHTGTIYLNGVSQGTPGSFAANDILGVKLDADAGTVQFYKNGATYGSAVTLSPAPSVSPYTILVYHNGGQQTINTGQVAFSYSVPTGAKRLSTANLPAPTIKKAPSHFVSGIYTGTGGALLTGTLTAPGVGLTLSNGSNIVDDNPSTTGSVTFASTFVGEPVNNRRILQYDFGANKSVTEIRASCSLSEGSGTWTPYYSTDGSNFTVITGPDTDPLNVTASTTRAKTWSFTPLTARYIALVGNQANWQTITATVQDFVCYEASGSDKTISGLLFKPDLMLIKRRDAASNWVLVDSLNGPTYTLETNTTNDKTYNSHSVKSFNSDGATLGQCSLVNKNSATYVYYAWKGDGTSGTSNTDGSITSTINVNTTAGFSIVKFTGTGSTGTVGHGLSATPKFIIVKNFDGLAVEYAIYHVSRGATKNLQFNAGAESTSTTMWNDTEPSSTVFTVGTNSNVNQNTKNIIAYCFTEIAGFSKFGSYTGNGSTDGPFVWCGFRPKYILLKNATSAGYQWYVWDTVRETYNPMEKALAPNNSNAEGSGSFIDATATGFKIRDNELGMNESGSTFIFAAFGEFPFGGTGTTQGKAR